MADNKGSIQVSAIVDDSLKLAINTMGEELRSVLRITNELNRNSMNTRSGLDSLNKALAGGTDSSSVYARATSNLSKHQQILSTYFKNAAVASKTLEQQLNRTTRASTGGVKVTKEQEAAARSYISTLNRQVAVQKSVSQVALKQDYKAQAAALTNLSNKYSMAGTRIGMSLTLPIVAFGRSAFSSYKTLEVQTVRTNKLINDSYVSMKDVANLSSDLNAKLSADGKSYTLVIDGQIQKVDTLETSMKNLGSQLDQITMKYGISRELIQGLAGDYAEIGINEVSALSRLVDLTALTEKLGNVDISESQNFIKSIFQTVQRVNRELDPSKVLDYGEAIDEITGQLAMFNLIENKTSLSLNNIAKGFPELTAAASSFGLSMGEATALMVPMVATGFQVGASANSVKVSLQRLVAMTKQNTDIIQELKAANKDFSVDAGVGIGTIQRLTDSYNTLKATKGEQGALEFFARIFGVRQGPRMEVAIQNLAQFQDALNRQGSVENELGKTFQKMIQKNTIGLGDKYSNFQIKKFEDLSRVVRLGQSKDKDIASAFSTSRQEFARYLKDQAAAGNDILADVKTEAGRAMIIAAAGGGKDSQAQAKFLQEVEASLNTAETRYNRSRELMKMIGRQVVPILGEVLKVIVPVLSFVTRILEKIGPVGKMVFGIGLAFLAAIGPTMKILGAIFQMKSAFASMRSQSPFGRFRTQAIQVSEDMVRTNELLFRMRGNLTQIGNKFYLQATTKEFKELQKAMNLQGGNAMQQARGEKILRRLGVDKRASDFSGLMGPTQRSVKEGFTGGDLSVLENYRKEMFDDLGGTFSRILTEARAVGTGIAEEFIAALNAAGFDTASIKGTSNQTLGALAGQRKLGPPQGPTSPPSPSGPGSGPGSGPSGTSPGSSGVGRRVKRGSTNPQTTPMPDIEPPVVEPFNPAEWGIEQVYGAIQETMEFLQKATKKQLVEFAKSMNIDKVSGLGLSSSALQAGTLRKHLMDAIMVPQQIVAKVEQDIQTAVETIKDVVQPGAPPAATKTDGVEKASDEVTTIVAEAQADKGKKAVEDQGTADAKAVQQKPARQPRATKTQGASEAGTEVVQEAQEKADVVAVKEQAAADAKAVTLIGAPGKVTSAITGPAREYASTLDQMWLNAQINTTKPIEDIIEALNLVKKTGTGSAGAFIFTKEKFLLLAETLGIDLPPIFNKMGELLDENGKALGVTKKSLIDLINAMTKLTKAPKMFTELNGQMVLEFEAELNRALMSGKGSVKRFNFSGFRGRVSDSISRAFTTETGSIFTDLTKKMPSQTGSKSGEGAVDYTKIKLTDLGYTFRPSPGYQAWEEQAKATEGKFSQTSEEDALAQNLGILKELRESLGKANVLKDVAGKSGREIFEMVNIYLDGNVEIARELVLSTKRTLNFMLQGVPNSRAKSALIRREMMTASGYAELISRQTTVPSMEPAQLKKDAKKRGITVDELKSEREEGAARREQMGITGPIDKMSEGQYKAFSKSRMKGINAARERSALIYNLTKQDDIESIEAAEKSFNEQLKQAAIGVDLVGSQRSFPRLQNFDVVGRIQKIIQERIDELKSFHGSLAKIPKPQLRSGEVAAVHRAGLDLTLSIKREENELAASIREQEAVVNKIADEIAGARANIANAKNITKSSEEGQALFGKGTKKSYIEKQEAIANDPKRAERLQLAIRELEIRQESVAALEEQSQALREQLALERQRLGIVGQTGEEYARIGQPADTRRMRPVVPQIVSPLESKVGFSGSVTSQVQAEAEAKLREARETLKSIEGSKIDFRMARNADTPEFIRSNAATRFKEIGIKIGRVFAKIDDDEKKVFEAIDKRIAKAIEAVEEAERNVNIAKASGGGGSAGGTSMRDSMMPMAGQRARGPRMPDIGPRLMSMTTDQITGGVANIYEELRQALNVPVDVMQQVIKDLQNGYTNSAGELRKAQVEVDKVGIKLTTEISKDIAGVVEALRAVLGAADLTVENVRNAFVKERQRITNFGKPSKAAATVAEKTSTVDISIPKVTKGDTPEYKKYEAERNALVAEIKAQIDELGTSEQQLLRIHADVLRPLARLYDIEGKIVNSGNKGKIIEALIQKVNKGSHELVIAQAQVLNGVATSMEKASSEKQAVAPAIESSLEGTEQVLVTEVVKQAAELEQVVKQAADATDTGPIVAAGRVIKEAVQNVQINIGEAISKLGDEIAAFRLSGAASPSFDPSIIAESVKILQSEVGSLGHRSLMEIVTYINSLRDSGISRINWGAEINESIHNLHIALMEPLEKAEQYARESTRLNEVFEQAFIEDEKAENIRLAQIQADADAELIRIAKADADAKIAAAQATAVATQNAQTGGSSGRGGRKPPVIPPAGGSGGSGPLPPTPAGRPIASINTSNLLLAYQYTALFTKAAGSLYINIAKVVFRMVPLGGTIWKVGSSFVGLGKTLLGAASASHKAGAGIKGFTKILTQNLDSVFDRISQSAKNIFTGGRGGGGRGRSGGGLITNQLSMSAGMLGTGPLGMMGGNVLQSLIQSMARIPVIGGPVVVVLGAITGGLMLLKKTQDSWGKGNKELSDNIKKAWSSIKEIFSSLLKPIEDFFGVLLGGTNTTVSGTEKAGTALTRLSAWFAKSMASLSKVVEEKVVPAFRGFLATVIVIFNAIKPVVSNLFNFMGAVFNRYTKDKTNALGGVSEYYQKIIQEGGAAGVRAANENIKHTDSISEAWKKLTESLSKLWDILWVAIQAITGSAVIKLMTAVNVAFINGFEQIFIGIVNIFRDFLKAFPKGIMSLVGITLLAIGSLAQGALLVLKSLAHYLAELLGYGRDLPLIGDDLGKATDKLNNFANSETKNPLEGILESTSKMADEINAPLDKLFDGVNASIGSWSNQAVRSGDKAQKKIKDGARKQLKTMIAGILPEGAGAGLMKSVGNLLKQAFANPAAADAAGQSLRDSVAKIKDIKLKATLEFNNSALDAVSGALGTAINKIKDDLLKQLNAQKDASLKVFDDQVAAIEALADAEQALTATESYETNRRRMIRDNELRKQNNRKDRSLAIYEGRVDDARSLDLQEIKDTQDFNDQLTDLDSGRKKELQAINRASAIATIKAQREAVAKEFDILIEGFEDYATKLLANGTFTKEQWDAQTLGLMTRATTTSGSINTTFTDGFKALPALISTNLNPVTAPEGFFSVGMATLAGYAAKSFGQATGVTDPTSILGLTRGVLGTLPLDANTAFGIGGPIQTSYGKGLTAVSTLVNDKLNGTGADSIPALFTQAITDAAAKMVAEITNKSADVAAAAAKLVTGINGELAKLKVKSITDAVAAEVKSASAAIAKLSTQGKSTTGKVNTNTWVAISDSSADRYIGNDDYELKNENGNLYYRKVMKMYGGSIPYARGGKIKYGMGGMMPYGEGGPTFGPMNMGIPATLHGGEFVIRKSAVDKYGLDMLNQVNKGIYAPKVPSLNIPMANYSKIANAGSSQQISSSESNHNYNFFVDNFIGETEWFNTMMKEYNVKVVPANQKQAGLESRVVKSYNGINRGM